MVVDVPSTREIPERRGRGVWGRLGGEGGPKNGEVGLGPSARSRKLLNWSREVRQAMLSNTARAEYTLSAWQFPYSPLH